MNVSSQIKQRIACCIANPLTWTSHVTPEQVLATIVESAVFDTDDLMIQGAALIEAQKQIKEHRVLMEATKMNNSQQ